MNRRFGMVVMLLSLLACLAVARVTYKSPPSVNETVLATFKKSPNDAKLIISPKLESLEVETATVNGTTTSTVTLKVFNRSAPGKVKSYEKSLTAGQWKFVASSRLTMSCSVIME